jgi:hypothetical protein
MRMTPAKLITLRLYAVTLGRIPAFSRLLKCALIHAMIASQARKYVASSRFFVPDDLE